MKCPDCGDIPAQQRLGPTEGRSDLASYRCARCGRLYAIPSDIADLTYRLAEMKSQLDALGLEMGNVARQIAAAESELLELRDRHAGGICD